MCRSFTRKPTVSDPLCNFTALVALFTKPIKIQTTLGEDIHSTRTYISWPHYVVSQQRVTSRNAIFVSLVVDRSHTCFHVNRFLKMTTSRKLNSLSEGYVPLFLCFVKIRLRSREGWKFCKSGFHVILHPEFIYVKAFLLSHHQSIWSDVSWIFLGKMIMKFSSTKPLRSLFSRPSINF